ncbi:HpcH/HpaI aldolase/citrate lyase family protein [Luteococcus japonicus]|uniref:Citrate lyase beta chain n=1 Tax=Luteococcus japonicus LSP_Lj1 TaxID=1255658 RepID=A0A1R4KE62_9ACTN|nr:CoA ester lyase [Luteococcus japonicus]SJN42661.1 Citrate lyase beta chain [Luteococcus japonicus LSP_Lj1]
MTSTPTPAQRISPDIARSWLLVNASRPELFDAAIASQADAVVLDVEDSVAAAGKLKARENVVDFFRRGGEAWVRINGFGTAWWEGDLDALAGFPGMHGVMLAMVETSEHVQKTAEKLQPHQKVVAMIETARAMMLLDRIAQSRGTFRIAFGLGDFRRDTGIDDDQMALAYTRSQLTIASRAAGLPGPIDGPAVGATGGKLANSADNTQKFGMRGKLCLTPEQCPIVNEVLSPSHDDIEWASSFLADFEAGCNQIRSASDTPKLARSRRLLDLALAFGIDVPGKD